jgi:NAD(P)-dependent dehydrogenase (short-subunit alcohol dehydrogenase family)
MHPLCDKVVLITGGSSGIGRATALRLAGHGARVAVAARRAEALGQVVEAIRAAGSEGLAVPTDVTEAEQCRQMVTATLHRWGRLDVLVCSAGLSLRALFADCTLEVLERVMRVNFFGTLHATYFALDPIRRARGSLVGVSSLTGKRGIPSYAIYGASKFAIQGLYESLRIELAPDGVHVGVVSPGFVDTPLREQVLGPDGRPWSDPPPPPFRIWPVEKCVDRIERLLVKRRSEALLPGFVRPMLALDQLLGGWLGNWILGNRFHPEDSRPPASPGKEDRPGGL